MSIFKFKKRVSRGRLFSQTKRGKKFLSVLTAPNQRIALIRRKRYYGY